MHQPRANVLRGVINDFHMLLDSYEAANGPTRKVVESDAQGRGASRGSMESVGGNNAENELAIVDSVALSDDEMENSDGDYDAPLRAPLLYELPAGLAPEDPCAYTEKHELKNISTRSELNWWDRAVPAIPPLIKSFKKVNKLEFTELERVKILKWGASYSSPCQILRNREYMRVFYFFAKFQEEVRRSVEQWLNRWGVRLGHVATCVIIPHEWIRHSPAEIVSLGRTDIKGLLFKLVPPHNERKNKMRVIHGHTLSDTPFTALQDRLKMILLTPICAPQLREWLLGWTILSWPKSRRTMRLSTSVLRFPSLWSCLVHVQWTFCVWINGLEWLARLVQDQGCWAQRGWASQCPNSVLHTRWANLIAWCNWWCWLCVNALT